MSMCLTINPLRRTVKAPLYPTHHPIKAGTMYSAFRVNINTKTFEKNKSKGFFLRKIKSHFCIRIELDYRARCPINLTKNDDGTIYINME